MSACGIPLSDQASEGRSRRLPAIEIPSDVFDVVSYSDRYGLPGRFASEPLRLHGLLLCALSELELATRPGRALDEAGFYDSIYDLVAPYHDRAQDLADCQYEAVACWLAVFAKPCLGPQEREARKLADLLHVVVQEDGWREPYRSQATSLAHSVFNRQSSGQAEFAVAASASDYGRRNVERVLSHLFRALHEDGDEWRTPLEGLARFLSRAT